MPRSRRLCARSLATGLLIALSGCGLSTGSTAAPAPGSVRVAGATPTTPSSPPAVAPTRPGAPSLATPGGVTTPPAPATSTSRESLRPEPRRSFVTIPRLGLREFPVVRYRGTPDDRPGTRIQNRGPMASPRGPGGGVGPGEVGNFIVTGHRTSHSAPLRDLPRLRAGDQVRVRSGGTIHVYEVRRTRSTSFRSKASLRAQAAAVPGRPGAEPVTPMITVSTCATPEDHAAGNFWSDELGNPEHRIDKIGVLVRSIPAR